MKKIVLVILIGLLIVLGSVVNSCESNTYQEISPAVANPTYSVNIEPIIRTTCTGCHGAQFPSLENYAEVREATENGNLICRIDDQSCGGVMPQQGKMPQSIIDMIKLWKEQGFAN